MFGDGLLHWHGVSRALATHWYHVAVSVQSLFAGHSALVCLMPEPPQRALRYAQFLCRLRLTKTSGF